MIENERIRPLGDRVLVKRKEEESQTAGGIYIPDAAKEKPQRGTVIAVGGGKKDTAGKHIPLDLCVGDTVYFGKYSGTEVDKDYLIIREDEVLGVVEKKA